MMIDIGMTVVIASWSVLAAMAPYLLLGFFVAGVLSVMISPEWVERHLGGTRLGQIFTASLFGVPLPLCSCGVLPVAASLRRHGAGKGATTAFLLSTPQTGVDSIAVTYGLLGPFLAVFRPIAALLTGFLGGALVHFFDPENGNGAPASSVAKAGTCADSSCSNDDGSGCSDAACSSGGECCANSAKDDQRSWLRALRYGFLTLPRDIGRALLVGVLISGVIAAFVEPHTLEAYLGGGLWPILVAMALGVPLYVCATASVPIALGLIHAGLSPGAAIAFLISGPATNGAAVSTLWKIMGRRTALLYLLTVAVGAVGSGWAVDALIASDLLPAAAVVTGYDQAVVHNHASGEAVGWFGHLSAVLLLGVMAASLWPKRRPPTAGAEAPEGEVVSAPLRLAVKGMRCNGCVQSLSRALGECSGVEAVDVDLERGVAELKGSHLDLVAVHAAVVALGFEVTNPEVLNVRENC